MTTKYKNDSLGLLLAEFNKRKRLYDDPTDQMLVDDHQIITDENTIKDAVQFLQTVHKSLEEQTKTHKKNQSKLESVQKTVTRLDQMGQKLHEIQKELTRIHEDVLLIARCEVSVQDLASQNIRDLHEMSLSQAKQNPILLATFVNKIHLIKKNEEFMLQRVSTDVSASVRSTRKTIRQLLQDASFDESKFSRNEQDCCTICCDKSITHFIVPCGHTFCGTCAYKFESASCGICRGPTGKIAKLYRSDDTVDEANERDANEPVAANSVLNEVDAFGVSMAMVPYEHEPNLNLN